MISTMALPFSSNDAVVIQRKITDSISTSVDYDLEDFFELQRCNNWICDNKFSKVALQFPDSLLAYSAEISLTLQKNTNCEIFILGDTSYGSCCVDEITAEHVSAEGIIHFGHACLSMTHRLPVLYIFGKKPLNVDTLVKEFSCLFKTNDSYVIIFYEVFYDYAKYEIESRLKCLYPNIVFSTVQVATKSCSGEDAENQCIQKCGRMFKIPVSQSVANYNIFYIGNENQTLMNLMLTFNKCSFFTYNPVTNIGRIESLDVNKYIRKRYYFIEKAKDAKIVGILIGTLGVSNYLTIIQHLRTIIKEAGKKAYVISVGKLNSEKLANFSEIEIFVYVSCSECSIIDTHEFYQPIITPFEMEIACNQARSWTGDYVTDFSEILPGSSNYVPFHVSTESVNDVSLITGKVRSLGKTMPIDNEILPSSSLALRDKMTVSELHCDAAGENLINRSWQGLDRQLGQTTVPNISQGKMGIASNYEGEGHPS